MGGRGPWGQWTHTFQLLAVYDYKKLEIRDKGGGGSLIYEHVAEGGTHKFCHIKLGPRYPPRWPFTITGLDWWTELVDSLKLLFPGMNSNS